MVDETAQEIMARYRRRDPYISLGQALALDVLSKRYQPLLETVQRRARLQRAAELQSVRQSLFGNNRGGGSS